MKIRLKYLCKLNPLSDKSLYGQKCTFLPMEKILFGTINNELETIFDKEKSGYTFMKEGYVIRATVTPCFENGKGAVLNSLKNGFAIGSTELMCVKPTKINANLLNYIFLSTDFINHCQKDFKGVGGLKRINQKNALNYEVSVSVLENQDDIVLFLDQKCSKIDNEVSLLEQKSILLDEYKNALIYETVTKGLDKNAEMKDSGVEWIGDIPKNWKIKRLKNCVTYLKLTKADLDSPDYLEIGDVDIKNNDYNLSNKEKLSVDTAKMSPKDVLLISTVRPNRKVITITKYEHPVSNAFCTLKCNKYWFYLVKTDGFSNELVKLNKSSIYPTCKDVDILNQQICIPSELEQVQIYLFLDLETKKIEKQIELINKKVELLKEYKQSLIYEAVTGQLEIE